MRMKKYSKDLNSESSSGLGCTTYDLTPEKSNKSFSIPTGVNNNNSDENLAIEPATTEEEKLGRIRS